MYPKLRAKYGDRVPYDEAPKEHILVEFAFDVLLVAHGGYKLQAYHDLHRLQGRRSRCSSGRSARPTGSR